MRWFLLVLVGLVPACLVVPKQKTTSHVTDSGSTPPRAGKAGELAMVASSQHAEVFVETYRPRTCSNEHYELYDVVAKKAAVLEVPKGAGGQGAGYAAVLSIFTL